MTVPHVPQRGAGCLELSPFAPYLQYRRTVSGDRRRQSTSTMLAVKTSARVMIASGSIQLVVYDNHLWRAVVAAR